MRLPRYPSFNRITPKQDRPKCGAKCRDDHSCQARAVWDYRHERPRNGRCRMHGGLSTGPKKKRDGRPAKVRKPLDWCRHEAARLQPGDFLFDIYRLVRLVEIIVAARGKCP